MGKLAKHKDETIKMTKNYRLIADDSTTADKHNQYNNKVK